MTKLKPIPKGQEITDAITKHIDKRFLSSTDIIGHGIINMTIDRVEKHDKLELNPGKFKENALVIYFKEHKKPLLLNATNIKSIAAALNTNIVKDWIGKKIKLNVETVKAFGGQKPAVRVVG